MLEAESYPSSIAIEIASTENQLLDEIRHSARSRKLPWTTIRAPTLLLQSPGRIRAFRSELTGRTLKTHLVVPRGKLLLIADGLYSVLRHDGHCLFRNAHAGEATLTYMPS